jgi:hypothetical protein
MKAQDIEGQTRSGDEYDPRFVSHLATTSLLWAPEDAAGLPERLLEGIGPDFRPYQKYRTAEELVRTAVLAGTMAVANFLELDAVNANLRTGVLPLLGSEGCYVVAAKKPGQGPLVPQYESLSPEDRFMSASLWLFMSVRQSVVNRFSGSQSLPDYRPVWELSATVRNSIAPETTHHGQLQMPPTALSPYEVAPDRLRDSLSQQLRFAMDHVIAVTRGHPHASTDTLSAEVIASIPAAEVAAGYPLGVARALMGAQDSTSQQYRRGRRAEIIGSERDPRFRGLEKPRYHTMCSAQSPHIVPATWLQPPTNPISLIDWHLRIASEVARHTLWLDRN